MHLAVFGASGPTGRHVVRQALAAGHRVTAVTRRPEEHAAAAHLTVAGADVGDARAVARAVHGADAVISTFGVPYSRQLITVYSRGIGNIIAAMQAHGVARLICVSSTTLAEEDAPDETWWWRRGVIPILRHVVGRTLYDDMARMEQMVRASGLDWTIVRPGGLFDADRPTGTATVSVGRRRGRYTARPDLAQALIAEATGSEHNQDIVEVLTAAAPPRPVRNFMREAFGWR